MAKRYTTYAPFNVPMMLLIPTETTKKGVAVKEFSEIGAPRIFGTFRTFGGTEVNNNNVITTLDTAVITTWYRPDIKADCRVKILLTNEIYEIIGTPENISMRNQYMQFKVQKVGGKP